MELFFQRFDQILNLLIHVVLENYALISVTAQAASAFLSKKS